MLPSKLLFALLMYFKSSENALLEVNASLEANVLLEAIFWEIKPFIFRTSEGSVDGIIPKMFSEGEYYCGNQSSTLISFKKLLPSRNKYFHLLKSKQKYGENELLEITDQKAVWFPDDLFTITHNDHEKARWLRALPIMKSEGLAVIMPRYMISLPNKMLRGIYSCRQILILILMLSLLFAMIMWFAECTCNKKFSKFFVRGTGTGIWWSLVSMTTVGYGDIVPRSIPGRLVASIWLFIGLVIACLMTATVTKVIKGLDGLDIYEQKVSVLENSYELKIVKEIYGAHVVPVESYETALEMVRNGKVFAALLNVDVASWLQREINNDNKNVPLRIVNIIPATLQINILISRNLSDSAIKAVSCMQKQKDEVFNRSIEHFRRSCHTESLYVDSITDMFQKSALYQLLLGFLVVIICLGLGFEIMMRRSKGKKNEIQSEARDLKSR